MGLYPDFVVGAVIMMVLEGNVISERMLYTQYRKVTSMTPPWELTTDETTHRRRGGVFMISSFCKTYLKAQGVQILDAPREKTAPLKERKPVAPVIVPQYERE